MLVGKVIGSIIPSIFGDLLTRKNFTIVGLTCSLLGLIIAVLQKSLTTVCIGLLLSLMGIQLAVIAALPILT